MGDFNSTLSTNEKWGGSIVRDPLCERLEDIILKWDLLNMKFRNNIYTWSNRWLGSHHIVAHIDRIMLHSSWLIQNFNYQVKSISNPTSDHQLLTLEVTKNKNRGPIPSKFNHLWL